MIANKKVVTMSYTLRDDKGTELDSANKASPFVYMHGTGQIIPGLEEALMGLKAGDKKDVTIAPADAYGEIEDQLKITVQRSMFPPYEILNEGMQFAADVGNGERRVFRIEKIDGDNIQVDGNHPLAGQTLHFQVEIQDVRDATQEEMEHGHAHGPGGHHHH